MSDEPQNGVLKNLVPWGLHPVPKFVNTELKRRAKAYAWSNQSENTHAVRTAWARVCSNGVPMSTNHEGRGLDGFVMFGHNADAADGPVGFDRLFGVGTNKQCVGYDVNKVPHTLTTRTFPNRPPPGFKSIEVEFYGAGSSFPGLCRKATIRWTCYSMEQLEYVTPYLLSLRVSMVIEWGWNTVGEASMVDLRDKRSLVEIFTNGANIFKRVEASGGNYDCHVGRIIDYGYTMDSQGNYQGFTVVVNPTFMFEGLNAQTQTLVSKYSDGSSGILDFVKNKFDNIISEKRPNFSQPEKKLVDEALRAKEIYVKPSSKWIDQTPSAKFWVNFRFLERMFNHFTSIEHPGVGTDLKLDISNVKIKAHPLLKSIRSGEKNSSVDVIIPNAFAPRLMRATSVGEHTTSWLGREKYIAPTATNVFTGAGNGRLTNITKTGDEFDAFKETADKLGKKLRTMGLVDVTDDLQSLLGSPNPFPMLTAPDSVDDVAKWARPGYWGYLGDIYVSNTLVKEAFDNADTVQRILEYILGKVSEAGSRLWEFRVIPNNPGVITVIDNNFNPITTAAKALDTIDTFVIGKTEDSAFQEYGMDVKMRQEMATQTLLGSNSSVDGKRLDAFTVSDRLYNTPGSFTCAKESPPDILTDKERKEIAKQKAEEEKKKEADRVKAINTRATDIDCVILENKQEKRFYITEKDPEFMKKILQIDESTESEQNPFASPMMPGTEFTFECQGVTGFYFLGMFSLSAVPKPYDRDHAVFQVNGVKHTIAENNWKTSITTQVRPLTTVVQNFQ